LIATSFKSIHAAIDCLLTNKIPLTQPSVDTSTSSASTSTTTTTKKQKRIKSGDEKEVDISQLWYSQSIALLIGIEDYPHMKCVKGAASSMKKLGSVLRESMGFEVKTLLNEQVTIANIMELIFSLKDIEENKNSRVVIMFVGHSLVEKTRKSNNGFFCCYDYDPADDSPMNLVKNAFHFRELFRTFEEYCYARHILLIFDCNFSEKILEDHTPNKSSLGKAMQLDSLYAITSGETDDNREEVGSFTENLCQTLVDPKWHNANNGYCSFQQIAQRVQSLEAESTLKFGHLNSSRGQVVFKLPTEMPSKDAKANYIVYRMKDQTHWYDMNQFWEDGLYLLCWENGVASEVSDVNLGWFTVPANKTFAVHTCVAHKSGDRLVIYEFGVYDVENEEPLDIHTNINLDMLALGTNACVVATEWCILDNNKFGGPYNLFTFPSSCHGYVTDLRQSIPRKWIRFTDQYQPEIQDISEKVVHFVQEREKSAADELLNADNGDQEWSEPAFYVLEKNNCHHFTHDLLCHLIDKKFDWVLQRLNLK
jgi:hypothetical protein